jgi:hypothetical protein
MSKSLAHYFPADQPYEWEQINCKRFCKKIEKIEKTNCEVIFLVLASSHVISGVMYRTPVIIKNKPYFQ